MDKGLVKQQSELCGLSLLEKQMLVLYVGNFNLLVCVKGKITPYKVNIGAYAF